MKKIVVAAGLLIVFSSTQQFCFYQPSKQFCNKQSYTSISVERMAIEGLLRDRLRQQLLLMAQQERSRIILRARQRDREDRLVLTIREIRMRREIEQGVLQAFDVAVRNEIDALQTLRGLRLIDMVVAAQQRIRDSDRLQS